VGEIEIKKNDWARYKDGDYVKFGIVQKVDKKNRKILIDDKWIKSSNILDFNPSFSGVLHFGDGIWIKGEHYTSHYPLFITKSTDIMFFTSICKFYKNIELHIIAKENIKWDIYNIKE